MDEAALCKTVHVLNHGRILASGTPEELRHIADGRCQDIAPIPACPMRALQSHLLDDPGITDAVPVCGKVHFITRTPGGEVTFLEEHPELPAATTSDERLEDAFMILLKEDEEKREGTAQVQKAFPSGEGGLRQRWKGSLVGGNKTHVITTRGCAHETVLGPARTRASKRSADAQALQGTRSWRCASLRACPLPEGEAAEIVTFGNRLNQRNSSIVFKISLGSTPNEYGLYTRSVHLCASLP